MPQDVAHFFGSFGHDGGSIGDGLVLDIQDEQLHSPFLNAWFEF
jgi:hypothetical protein